MASSGERGEAGDPAWIVDMIVMLGSLGNNELKACSISRVPDNIRSVKEGAYSPKYVSIGPFHRKDRIDLQIMEETKWRYMLELFTCRAGGECLDEFKKCSKAIREIDSVVRASYGGDIELKPEEHARIMVLDGCFFLELLLRLYENVTGNQPHARDEIYPSLGSIDDKILRVLTDLTLLENQIPSVVLTTLASMLFKRDSPYKFPSPKKIAESLFEYDGDSLGDVCHFLHLMHKSSQDPYGNNVKSREASKELGRCATKLQAVGIKIKTSQIRASTDNKTGIVASTLKEFVDRFDFKIDFEKGERELIIPPLHIKGGTEVKWRNLIALEQSGVKIGYKFTSYAYFFNGLISSVHDIKLLRGKKVIVHDKKTRDEDLLKMFQNITTGAERMDERYSKMCKKLNKVSGNPARKCWIMWWYYCRIFWAWLLYVFKNWFQIFVKVYIPDLWKFIALVAATALLVLTFMQTYYAAKTYYAPVGH